MQEELPQNVPHVDAKTVKAAEREAEREAAVQEAFVSLQAVAQILRDMGFKVIDDFITLERLNDPVTREGGAFPIVRDGADGIRVVFGRDYVKGKGYVMNIVFTNGFEEPDNPQRMAVVEKIKDLPLVRTF